MKKIFDHEPNIKTIFSGHSKILVILNFTARELNFGQIKGQRYFLSIINKPLYNLKVLNIGLFKLSANCS